MKIGEKWCYKKNNNMVIEIIDIKYESFVYIGKDGLHFDYRVYYKFINFEEISSLLRFTFLENYTKL